MSAQHTPGPWQVWGRHFDIYREASSEYICQAARVAGESRDANARLIAAAPELLDALQEMVMAVEGVGLDAKARRREAMTAAIAALAKARGEVA